jgi:hypothetical protein
LAPLKKRLATLFLVVTVVAAQATSQSPTTKAEVEALCKTVLCRTPRPIRLKTEGGKFFELPSAPASPIVTGEMITVLAGETAFVEGTLKGGRLVDLIAVSKIKYPERTLVLSLHQEASVGDGLGMILKVTSPFPKVLKYRLGIMSLSDDDLRKTSVCPLFQGKPVYEHWPYPLFQVAARDFIQIEPTSSAAGKCE